MDESKFSSKEKEVVAALKKIIDPELGIGIVDLGLIYEVKVDDGTCYIKWTLTTMGCPIVDMLQDSIHEAAMNVEGINKCEVKLVYYPQWTADKISREARLALGIHL